MSKTPVVFHLRISPEDTSLPPATDATTELRPDVPTQAAPEVCMNTLFHVIQAHDVAYGEGTHCFWCRHSFEGQHYSQLRSYDIGKAQYDAYGCYCSPHCAMADLDASASYYWDAVSLMQSVWGVFKPAPSWQLLRAYGGALDIRQFRQMLTQPDEPRMITLVENHIYPTFVVTIPSVMDKAAGRELRLQRRKPIASKN